MRILKNVGLFVVGLAVAVIIGPATSLSLRADQPTPAATVSLTESPVDSAKDSEIRTLIKKLDANEFQDREQATQKLLKFGVGCVKPLVATTESSSREAAHRSLSLLEQFLNQKSDHALSAASEKALDEIAETRKNWVGQRASQALLHYNLTNQAGLVQKLSALGAEVEYDEESPYSGIRVTVQSKNWQGKPTDWQLLKKLPNLAHLQVFGPIIGDDELPILSSLATVEYFDLYGTKVSDAGFNSLKATLSQATIDRRKGGMLGIQGDITFTEGCRIQSVQEKSAAAEAGLAADDIIKKIDGKELTSFKDLTTIVGEKGAGDKMKIEIQRGEEKISRDVSLSAWRPDQTPAAYRSGFQQFQGNIIVAPQGRIIFGR